MLRNLLAVATLPLCFVLAGCGGSSSTGSGTTTTTPPQPGATLSTSAVSFPTTTAGSTATASPVTLTNTGTGTLTISPPVVGGTNQSNFGETNTCGSSLAAGASCTITATFTPSAAATYNATITITDNATGSPQIIALSGSGSATAGSPTVTLSSSTMAFGTVVVGDSGSSSVTVSNSGTAALAISSIALSGTNQANFAETNTCGSSLAVNASCTITGVFTPAASTNYTATLSITDNATGSPQTIALTGSGTTTTVTHTLLVFPAAFPDTLPDANVAQLYSLINAATKTVDMTMYALEDTTFSGDLVALCKNGIKVRVILDINDEQSGNTPAYNQLNAQTNCSAVWANTAFEATHEKSFVIDFGLSTQKAAIMSLNLQSSYYSTTRDFALIENDPADIASIEATFNADYAAGTPSSGTQGTSDFSYVPTYGNNQDLIWSPTNAQTAMVNIIANAKSTLVIENEEMASSASYIISALETACHNGVQVHIAMVDQSDYEANFTALVAAGCGVHTVPDTTNGFYIHAKAVVADFGLSTQNVYMGSINYSNASMNNNRELGIYITDTPSVTLLNTTMTSDYNNATPWP